MIVAGKEQGMAEATNDGIMGVVVSCLTDPFRMGAAILEQGDPGRIQALARNSASIPKFRH
jgi:hypothetical protein